MNSFTLDQKAADLLSLWDQARGVSILPHSRFIDPVALRRWIGSISVVQLHQGPKRFFVSLHSMSGAPHVGVSYNRQYLEDIVPADQQNNALAPYLRAIETTQPVYSIQQITRGQSVLKHYERMVLPCYTETADAVERFLVWIPPIGRIDTEPSSIYEPLAGSTEADLVLDEQSHPVLTNEIFVLTKAHMPSQPQISSSKSCSDTGQDTPAPRFSVGSNR